ncbi:MAG: hypothetical protein AAF193_07350 [Bacteroidota bacterium]
MYTELLPKALLSCFDKSWQFIPSKEHVNHFTEAKYLISQMNYQPTALHIMIQEILSNALPQDQHFRIESIDDSFLIEVNQAV